MDRPIRLVVRGTEQTVLVRIMKREVRFVIRGVIYAFNDQMASFVRCHTRMLSQPNLIMDNCNSELLAQLCADKTGCFIL